MAFLKKGTSKKEKKLEIEISGEVSRGSRSGEKAANFGVLLHPHITEKTAATAQGRTYTFAIAPKANKSGVKNAIESRYGVHVIDVRTVTIRGKEIHRGKQIGWKQGMKKAVVKIKAGEQIELE